MTHIFIFNNASRAAHYGIGTYVRQLAEGLRECPDTTVSFVDFFADVKEYTVSDDACGCRHYRIPSGPSGGEDESSQRCAFYFLARHIRMPEGSRLVFQFNYFQHHLLASLLKGRYADCRIVLTVHYLSWCFELKGNLESFRRMTAKDYEPQNDKERQVTESVKGEKAFLHLADEVIVISDVIRNLIKRKYSSGRMLFAPYSFRRKCGCHLLCRSIRYAGWPSCLSHLYCRMFLPRCPGW